MNGSIVFNNPPATSGDLHYLIDSIFYVLNIPLHYIGFTFTLWEVITCSGVFLLFSLFVSRVILFFVRKQQ